MSAQDKKVFKTLAFSAGGALLVHLAAFLFFAALMQAGYFSPPPPKDQAEQFEITFVEDEVAEPEPETPPAELAMVTPPATEEPKSPSAFINTDRLTEVETPNESAPFFSDKSTKAASEAPPEEGLTSPMPTITEGTDRDLPTKDLFQQTYTEGPGATPQPEVMEAAPPTPPAPAEPIKPEVAETPPMPVIEPEPAPEPPKPEIVEAKPEPAPEPPATAPEIAKVEPAAMDMPAMPEATLPPVPEVSDVPEPEEKTPDPEVLAAVDKPKTEPAKPKERETADPTAPSLDPALNPGGFQPDPTVVALLDMTPKDAPLPTPKPEVKDTPQAPTPETAEKPDVESLLDRQRRRSNSATSGYQAQRNPTRMKGGVSNKGSNSVDAQGTPFGRYQAEVSSIVERSWLRNTKAQTQNFNIGTVKVRFSITKSGAVKNITIVSNTSNTLFGTNCIKSLQESKLPAVPDELDVYLVEGTMEVEYTFAIY